MADELVLLERAAENKHIAIVTLNRPDAGNALNTPVLEAMADRFDEGEKVDPAALEEAGLIHDASRPVKILGTGEISKNLDVEATRFSTAAATKITQAGGTIRSTG